MIKAIQTFYNGYHFRSRLEARWAVFFGTLNVPYEYEKEGFDLEGSWYLPDFWLPRQQCWVEIKPWKGSKDGTFEGLDILAKLVKLSKHPGLYIQGTPGAPRALPGFSGEASGGRPWDYYVTYRPVADRATIGPHLYLLPLDPSPIYLFALDDAGTDALYLARFLCGVCLGPDFPTAESSDVYCNVFHPRLVAAYEAARQARFEHGERPHV